MKQAKKSSHPVYDLEHTAFLLLTGNPTGFHHLLLTECALRQFPQIQRVVFILSNGNHPDPTKKQSIPDKQIRLEILKQTLKAFGNPEESYPAKLLQSVGETFWLNEEKTEISTFEFEQNLSFRISDHEGYIRQNATLNTRSLPIKVIIGADLLNRMTNPHIFSDTDLRELQGSCEFLIAPREHYEIEQELASLAQHRQCAIKHSKLDTQVLPEVIRHFMQLSATHLRKLIQANQRLTEVCPLKVVELLRQHHLYEHIDRELLNEWERQCLEFERRLFKSAQRLKTLLDQREEQQRPHTLALLETSAGGHISAAFTQIAGASRHFREGTILYDANAQKKKLGKGGREKSVITAEAITALTQSVAKSIGTDFVLGESGMAGPLDSQRHSQKNGQCYLALVAQEQVLTYFVQENPFLSKREHQLLFAIHAMEWMIHVLGAA